MDERGECNGCSQRSARRDLEMEGRRTPLLDYLDWLRRVRNESVTFVIKVDADTRLPYQGVRY